MHALLVMRADALEGCTEVSPEETELAETVDVIEAYDAMCWPLGKEPDSREIRRAAEDDGLWPPTQRPMNTYLTHNRR